MLSSPEIGSYTNLVFFFEFAVYFDSNSIKSLIINLPRFQLLCCNVTVTAARACVRPKGAAELCRME